MTRKIKNTPSEDIESVDAPEITFKKVDNPKKMDAEKTKSKPAKTQFLTRFVFLIFLVINFIVLLGIVLFVMLKEASLNRDVEELKKTADLLSEQLSTKNVDENFAAQILALENRVEQKNDTLRVELEQKILENSNNDGFFLTENEVNNLILKETIKLGESIDEKISIFQKEYFTESSAKSGQAEQKTAVTLKSFALPENNVEIDQINKEINRIKTKLNEVETLFVKSNAISISTDNSKIKNSVNEQEEQSMALLKTQFVVLAREALQKEILNKRKDNLAVRVYHYVRSKFVLRSTSPQEGMSANAILSRAEYHLHSGNLREVLKEIEKLDEESKGIFKEWKNSVSSLASNL